MSETHKLGIGARMSRGGSMAEDAFERRCPYKFLEVGFRNPTWNDGVLVGSSLPPKLTAMPDFIMRHPTEGSVWVEVMGMAGNTLRALKNSKTVQLQWWEEIMPMYLYVWNSQKKLGLLIKLKTLMWSEAFTGATLTQFPNENVWYYPLKWEDLHTLAEERWWQDVRP